MYETSHRRELEPVENPAQATACNREKSRRTGAMERSKVIYCRMKLELIGAFQEDDSRGCNTLQIPRI